MLGGMRAVATSFSLLVVLVALGIGPLAPVPPATGQSLVVLTIDIVDDLVKTNVSNETDIVLPLGGRVEVDKLGGAFVPVNVSLTPLAPANFTATVEPRQMQFLEKGEETFVLTVVIPAGTRNVTGITVTVEGQASTAQFKTATDDDKVEIVLEYPVEETPEPPEDPVPDDLDTGPDALVICMGCIIIGSIIASILHWKGKLARRRRGKGRGGVRGSFGRGRGAEVVYVRQRRKGPGGGGG